MDSTNIETIDADTLKQAFQSTLSRIRRTAVCAAVYVIAFYVVFGSVLLFYRIELDSNRAALLTSLALSTIGSLGLAFRGVFLFAHRLSQDMVVTDHPQRFQFALERLKLFSDSLVYTIPTLLFCMTWYMILEGMLMCGRELPTSTMGFVLAVVSSALLFPGVLIRSAVVTESQNQTSQVPTGKPSGNAKNIAFVLALLFVLILAIVAIGIAMNAK